MAEKCVITSDELKIAKHYFIYNPSNQLPLNYFDDVTSNSIILNVNNYECQQIAINS